MICTSHKVYLSPSNQTANTYAYGSTTEAIQCGRIAQYCKIALERNGIEAMIGHMIDMPTKCKQSDDFGAEIHLPIHTNAFNTKTSGTRIFCYSTTGNGYKISKAIFAALAPVTPGTSENIKANTTLYEIVNPKAPTCYCEVDFHDNADVAKWIIENVELIGETIAKGICDYFGIKFISNTSTSSSTVLPVTNPVVTAVKTNPDDVIKCALNEVGYTEKESNFQLDDKTANAGDENYTKYARDLDAVTGFYNGRKNGYSWCDVFNDWCYYKTYGKEIAQKLLCQPNNSMGAGCDYSAKYYQNAGQWYKSPQVGDQIFFKTATYSYAHTGIVYRVAGNMVYTIEGNTKPQTGVVSNGGMVCAKAYNISDSSIVGYGRPKWDTPSVKQVEVVAGTIIPANSPAKKYVQAQVQYLILGSQGSPVKVMQTLLNFKGFDCGTVDGDFGNKTLNAVKSYQTKNGLTVDGEVGLNTWNKLLS